LDLHWLLYILVPAYIIVCVFLIGVVLLQQGKGADLAGAFGVGGGTQAAFGARSATTLLHRLTTGSFVAFIVLALTISLVQAVSLRSTGISKSLSRAATAPSTGAAAPKLPATSFTTTAVAMPVQQIPATAAPEPRKAPAPVR